MRIRVIHPEFWTDEGIGELSMAARLAYIASWNVADDEGRLRGKTNFLKGQIFPYDSVDMEKVKQQLSASGRWRCYRVGGEDFIQISSFSKYQKIDRPTRSRIPAPDMLDEMQLSHPDSTNPRRGLDEASMQKEKRKEKCKEKEKEKPRARSAAATAPPPGNNNTHAWIGDLWNSVMHTTPIPTINAWPPDLGRLAAERVTQNPGLTSDDWRRAFRAVADSPFLRGEVPGPDGTPFTGATRGGLSWFLTGPIHLRKALAGEAPYSRQPSMPVHISPCPPNIIPDQFATDLWRAALAVLRMRVDDESYSEWFADTEGLAITDNTLQILVPSRCAQNWLASHYKRAIEDALAECTSEPPEHWQFIVGTPATTTQEATA